MKKCSSCLKNKNLSDFYRDNRRRDRLRPWCKLCCNKDSKGREHKYKETRDFYRESAKTEIAKRNRKRYEKDKNKILKSNKEWRLSKRGRLASYRRSAEQRSIDFKLSEEEFFSFWNKPCYYCSGSIDTIGLDRLDSTLGYSLDNVVSCCEICNKMKMILNVEEFINHISKIHDNLFGGHFYEVR